MFTCAYSANVRAQSFRSIDQLPSMIDPADARVVVANVGTTALNISYLDETWHTIQIPPGQYATLASQDAGLSVLFNDGVEVKSVTLNSGTTYALYWNSGVNRWAIAPYDEVARRASGFRSR